jgi:tRNA pseudouridine55 synthase
MAYQFEEGEVLLIDKPYRWTSFDAVRKIRNTIKIKKIGHAGTLDPLATGLLILCTGKKTKQIDTYQAQEKEYTGQLVLGKTTPSVDLETEFDQTYSTSHITQTMLLEVAKSLTGTLQQIPPIYSAIQVDGQRVYKKARRGETVELKPREVQVQAFDITQVDFPVVHFRIICSKGTYIRSLVRDFGIHLQSGAYLAALRRVRIGEFDVADAQTIEEFIQSLGQQHEGIPGT